MCSVRLQQQPPTTTTLVCHPPSKHCEKKRSFGEKISTQICGKIENLHFSTLTASLGALSILCAGRVLVFLSIIHSFTLIACNCLTFQIGLKMTESQLPAAAAAQKFGTLIPNRIFGKSRGWWSGFFSLIASCHFHTIFKSDARSLFGHNRSSSRSSWRNKVINYILVAFPPFPQIEKFRSCVGVFTAPRPPRVSCVECSRLMAM